MGRAASELSGGRSKAPDEAAAHPLFRADFHADPPVKTFKHFEDAHNTEMTGGIGVACVHDPRSGQKWHIDANGIIKGSRPRRAGASTGLEATVTGLRTNNVVL